MIHPAAIALLCACACQSPTLPAPGCWERGRLRPGVLAVADLETLCVTYDDRLFAYPDEIQAAVILHEICHLRGHVTEEDADCCAAAIYAHLYGVDQAIAVAYFWMGRRPMAVAPWLRCSL